MMPALFAKAKAQRSTACRKGDDQQRSLPDCTDDCRRQLNAITDELLDRLRAAGEIDPALTTAACHTICRPFKKYHTNVKSAPIPGALFLIQNGLPDPFGRLYNTRYA